MAGFSFVPLVVTFSHTEVFPAITVVFKKQSHAWCGHKPQGIIHYKGLFIIFYLKSDPLFNSVKT